MVARSRMRPTTKRCLGLLEGVRRSGQLHRGCSAGRRPDLRLRLPASRRSLSSVPSSAAQARCSPETLAVRRGWASARAGAYLACCAASTCPKPRKTRVTELGGDDYYVYASDGGVYEALVNPGDEVKVWPVRCPHPFPRHPLARAGDIAFQARRPRAVQASAGALRSGRLSVPPWYRHDGVVDASMLCGKNGAHVRSSFTIRHSSRDSDQIPKGLYRP